MLTLGRFCRFSVLSIFTCQSLLAPSTAWTDQTKPEISITVNIEIQSLVTSCNITRSMKEHESVDVYSITIHFNNATRKLG